MEDENLFMKFMNKYGGAQIFVLTGLISVLLLIGLFFIYL